MLAAERIEDPAFVTALVYGHGDTVRGLDDLWRPGLKPWQITVEGERIWLDRFDHLINDRDWNRARLALLERLLAFEGVEIVLVCEIDPLEFMHRRLRSPSDSATSDTYVTPAELDRWAELARRGLDEEAFAAAALPDVGDDLALYDAIASTEQSRQGLRRYWIKKRGVEL